eukprot:2173624-Rhodomonas_salina.1
MSDTHRACGAAREEGDRRRELLRQESGKDIAMDTARVAFPLPCYGPAVRCLVCSYGPAMRSPVLVCRGVASAYGPAMRCPILTSRSCGMYLRTTCAMSGTDMVHGGAREAMLTDSSLEGRRR